MRNATGHAVDLVNCGDATPEVIEVGAHALDVDHVAYPRGVFVSHAVAAADGGVGLFHRGCVEADR